MKFNHTVWGIRSKLYSVDQILADREIVPQTRGDLHDPFLLEGMSEAARRIERAVANGEYIWIYGDYDVDGITSCAIMMRYFERVGARAAYYIPNRQNEGYGLSVSGLEEIRGKGADLVITVDCGINAFDEAEYARSIGLDLIITDHHKVEEKLPVAVAVVNPKRGRYPFPHLAGCGVAFKLVQALSGESFGEVIDEIIDIAAIGTVADIVSLQDENRIIVSEGLRHIQNLGLRVLIRTVGKNPERLTTSDVGYMIAPVINACGRIGNPMLGVELMLTDDEALAVRMARKLYALNSERQEQCRLATDASIRMVEQRIDLSKTKVLVVCGEDWHSGVIGIVASRLADIYHRPAVVLTKAGDGDQLKGSARSVSGVSIYRILSDVKDCLLRFGGHDLAAGLTLEEARYEDFVQSVQLAANVHMHGNHVVEKACDYEVAPELLTMEFVSGLDRIQPCGLGNSEPVFMLDKLKIANIKAVGADQRHAKLTLKSGMGTFDGIAFGMMEAFSGVRSGDFISILFSPEISAFGGTESVSLKIKDVHSGNADFHKELKRKMDEVTARYIIQQPRFCFTRNLDFDKIKKLNTVDVYTYEDMKKLQKWVYEEDMDHEIFFGDEKPEDAEIDTDGKLIIRFMPTPQSEEGNTAGVAMLDYIPQRKDVESVFRVCKKFSMVKLDVLSLKLRMYVPKILVAFELLKDLQILKYEVINDHVHLQWRKPEQTKKLEETALFQKMMRESNFCLESDLSRRTEE